MFAFSSNHRFSPANGYAGGVLSADQLRRIVPSAYAEAAHESRSQRYTYIPTSQVIEGMRAEGFLPVKATQSAARNED